MAWRTWAYRRLDRPGLRRTAGRVPGLTAATHRLLSGEDVRPVLETSTLDWEGHRFDIQAPPALLARAGRRWVENLICRLVRGAAEAAPRSATVVDVGANHGFVSLVAADALGPDGRTIAVECDHAVAAALRRNLGANGFGATSTVAEAAAGAPGAEITVDELVERHGRGPVAALKIDTDGTDLDVLRGAEATLARDHPLVVVELTRRAGEIVDLLRRHYPVVGDELGRAVTDGEWPPNAVAWTDDYEALTVPRT